MRAAAGHPLVGEVVDREDGGRAVQRLRPLDGVHVDGHERRLPVVGVDDVGHEAERLAQLQRAAREEGEALQVVGVALARRAVEVRAIEVAVVLEEVDRHVAAGQPPEPHASARRRPTTIGTCERARRAAPARSSDARRRAASPRARRCRGARSALGSAPATSAEAAGLGERRALRGDEQDLEGPRGFRHRRALSHGPEHSGRVDAVVDVGEDVVLRLDVGERTPRRACQPSDPRRAG